MHNTEYNVHSGFETLALSFRNTEELKLVVDECINTSLLMIYSRTWGSLQVKVIAPPYNSLTLMLENDGSEDMVPQVGGSVHRDASLTLALCELNAGNIQTRVTPDLCEEGVFAALYSACIAASRKQLYMQCNHLQVHTEDLVGNYVIVEEDGQYRMEATGEIIKGVREGNSHQKIKVLTMSERHNSEVVPVLLTGGNDMEASHVITLGQLDENQLYYLQVRGLSHRQTLSLLTAGYIVPITELFDQEEVRTTLRNGIEVEVDLHA